MGLPIPLMRRRKSLFRYYLKTINPNLILLAPMDELSGTTAKEYSGVSGVGTYDADVVVGGGTFYDGSKIASYPGNGVCVFTSTFADARFYWEEYSFVFFAKASAAEVWSDGNQYNLLTLYSAETSQRVEIRKEFGVPGRLSWLCDTGAALKTVTKDSVSTLDWFMVGGTVSKTADQMIAYFNGLQNGATQTSIGTDDASALERLLFGAGNATGGVGWSGPAGYLAIWSAASGAILTPAQMLQIYQRVAPG